MKFLSPNMDSKNLMILNTYYDRGGYDMNIGDDVLDIIYKDIDTGKKYVETIKNPDIEIWIVKPEFRTYSHIKDFEEIDRCIPVKIKYKSRYKALAKILKVPYEQVKFSPYIYQADMDICHFYMMQFSLEYGNTSDKTLSIGFLDIENDIINVTGFPEPGEAPINAVSYMDVNNMQMYTLILTTDNLPIVPETHPKYRYYETLRQRFRTNVNAVETDLDGIVTELNETYDEIYGKINYQLITFDNEINLIVALFQIINACDNDYIGIWNSPYDMQNLIERPRALGYDPNTLICQPEFGRRRVYFHEDTNAMVHKRKHLCNTYTKYTVVDQMVIYAGIRSGRGKLPSVKLNAIARNELGDEKLDYSEYGNIRMFPYHDFRKFIIYNIKDVLLQFGINKKTSDMDSFYTSVYMDCVSPPEVNTSTTIISNSLRLYAFKNENSVMGSNRAKLYKNNVQPEELVDPDDVPDDNEEDIEELGDDIDESNDEELEDVAGVINESTDPKKRDKFKGAFVMSPVHMSPSGFNIMATPAKYIHDNVIDEDIESEYPTGMSIMNSCNETLVGKVFLDEPTKIKIPFYDNMYFVDKKDDVGYNDYRKDASNFMMEVLTQDDPLNFAHLFLGIDDATVLLDYIGDNLDLFVK